MGVKVLEVMDAQIDAKGWKPMIEARAAVAELIEAAGNYFTDYCLDEADDTFECSDFGEVTGCTREQRDAAQRLRLALARCNGGAA